MISVTTRRHVVWRGKGRDSGELICKGALIKTQPVTKKEQVKDMRQGKSWRSDLYLKYTSHVGML